MDIKLKVKLSAYSKLPILDYINDVPKSTEDKIYGRKNGQWVELEDIGTSDIIVEEGSGLDLIEKDEHHRSLSVRQYLGIEPEIFEDDTTYYIVEITPNLFINGGTAFSSGYEEFNILNQFKTTINGGNSSTVTWELELKPLNSKGVLDE